MNEQQEANATWGDVLVDAAQSLSDALEMIAERLDGLEVKCEELAALPCYERAVLHYRAGRYAYVYITTRGEGRKRVYLGTNKEKIAAAEQAIERGVALRAHRKQHDDLQKSAERWAARVSRAVASAPVQ